MRLRAFNRGKASLRFYSFVGIGLETILQWVSSIIKSLGISSRTIDMLLQGEIADDNNRSRIYETAQMINGGLSDMAHMGIGMLLEISLLSDIAIILF